MLGKQSVTITNLLTASSCSVVYGLAESVAPCPEEWSSVLCILFRKPAPSFSRMFSSFVEGPPFAAIESSKARVRVH